MVLIEWYRYVRLSFLVGAAFLWFMSLFAVVHPEMGVHTGICAPREHVSCAMNPLEHLAIWQSLFSVSLTKMVAVTLLGFAVFLFVRITESADILGRMLGRLRALFSRKDLLFSDPLVRSFSRGILNPKLF